MTRALTATLVSFALVTACASTPREPARIPPQSVVDKCNKVADEYRTGESHVLRDTVIGGAAGAGVGAAGGAIADGGSGAGKGAGVGAVAGAAIGALYGLNERNKQNEPAKRAYSNCLAQYGY